MKNLFQLLSKAFVITLTAALTALAVNAFRPEPLQWQWLLPSVIAPLMENFGDFEAALGRSNLVLVDARHPSLYQMAHIPGAVSLPLAEADPARLAEFQKNISPQAEIIIYCSDPLCPMAGQLAELMLPLGLKPAVFSPGFETWADSGRPVSSGRGSP